VDGHNGCRGCRVGVGPLPITRPCSCRPPQDRPAAAPSPKTSPGGSICLQPICRQSCRDPDIALTLFRLSPCRPAVLRSYLGASPEGPRSRSPYETHDPDPWFRRSRALGVRQAVRSALSRLIWRSSQSG
jgi:hypothetical protein